MNLVEPIRTREKIDAMKAYLREKNLRDYTLFCLGINSGLRVSDLLALQVADISSLQDGRRLVKERLALRDKKTGKVKEYPLSPQVRQVLNEYLSSTHPQGWLFPSRLGSRQIDRTQAWRIISEAARAVGVSGRIGTHTLRKTFGYWAFKHGYDITLIQKLLNQSSPGITLAYIGITKAELDEVCLALNL